MNYIQVTYPNLSTTDYPGACGRFVFNAFGAKNGWGFNTATEAWNGQANKHVCEEPPRGVAVPIWFEWWGTVNNEYKNWGHVAISLPDGRVLTSPVNPKPNTPRQDILLSIKDMMAALGGKISYLGWTESMDGTTVVVSGNEDNMSQKTASEVANTYQGVYYGAEVLIDGKVQKFNYGILPIVAHNQTLIAQLIGMVNGLTEMVANSSGGSVDMDAIVKAAEEGSRNAMLGMVFKPEVNDA